MGDVFRQNLECSCDCDRMKKWFVKCGTDDIPAPLLEGARWCLDGCTRVAPTILNLDFLFGIWRCGH